MHEVWVGVIFHDRLKQSEVEIEGQISETSTWFSRTDLVFFSGNSWGRCQFTMAFSGTPHCDMARPLFGGPGALKGETHSEIGSDFFLEHSPLVNLPVTWICF